MSAVDLWIGLLAAPLIAACAYLGLLTALSFGRRTGVTSGGGAGKERLPRFDVLVPAHDEETGIARTVESLRALRYPADAFRVVVVADNCTDATAVRARAAGAVVWERFDERRRGKGYALQSGFDRSLADGYADAVVVVDADTQVTPNLLEAFAGGLAQGAQVLQAHYGVLNTFDSWRTRLMALAFALFHGVRSSGRERLGLSCGLRGNGMCFSAGVLRAHPHDAFSVVEDVEYGIRLGLAGIRVRYVADAEVLGEMPSSERAARTQRRRWESGRMGLLRAHLGALLRRAVVRRDPVALDLAADLLIPPLSVLALATAALGVAAAMVWGWAGAAPVTSGAFAVCAALLAAYVARGWTMAGLKASDASALLRIPGYVLWKVWIAVRRPEHARGEWVRTARER